MKNFKCIYLLTCCIIIFSCSKELKDDASQDLKKNLQNVSVPKKSNKSNSINAKLNSVCNCYKEALSTLDEILVVRNNFNSFDDYTQDQKSIVQVKTLLKQWREIQSYCLQTYKRAMYWENDCYPTDSVEKKRLELNDLGIKS